MSPAGREPGKAVAIGVESHLLDIIEVLADDGTDQFDRDAHPHQVVDSLIDPGKAVFHPADGFVDLVIGAVEGDFNLPGRAAVEEAGYLPGDQGRVGLEGEEKAHSAQFDPDFREVRMKERFPAGDAEPGGACLPRLPGDAEPFGSGQFRP